MRRLQSITGYADQQRELLPYLFVVLLVSAVALQARLMPFEPAAIEIPPSTAVEIGSAPLESVPPAALREADMPVPTVPILPMESAPPEASAAAPPEAETVAPLLGGGSIGRPGIVRPGILPRAGAAMAGKPGIKTFEWNAVTARPLHGPFESRERKSAAPHKVELPHLKAAPSRSAPVVMRLADLGAVGARNGLSGNAFTNHGQGPGAVGGPAAATARSGAVLNGTDLPRRP
jgi:hypothetical protein